MAPNQAETQEIKDALGEIFQDLRDIHTDLGRVLSQTGDLQKFRDKVIILENNQQNCRARQMSDIPNEQKTAGNRWQMVAIIISLLAVVISFARYQIAQVDKGAEIKAIVEQALMDYHGQP